MDARTRSAVRAYQKARGLDSGLLALETAQRLGLAYYAPPPKRLT
jgi:peptidoglycan hydrolase-like protein with peptidoglycan-binding domain